MNVVVAYASRLGSTREIAARIADRLRSAGVDATASEAGTLDSLASADAVVVGSGVYEGHWLPEAKSFVRQVATTPPGRPVWLFSSGPLGRSGPTAEAVEPNDIAELRRTTQVRDHRMFGGSLDRGTVDGSHLSFPERFVAKHFVPEGDFRDWPEIDAWADGIARELVSHQPAS